MLQRDGETLAGAVQADDVARLLKSPGPVFARARMPGKLAAGILGMFCLSLLSAMDTAAMGKMSGGGYVVARGVAAAEGRRMATGGLIMNATVGEVGGGMITGGGFRVRPGHIALAAQPGSITSITAVTKATGALELAWEAPGLDGFSGDVANGFYRIDYSTDSAHVFRPTVYQLEFSTTVAANEPQTLNIQGLLPNTTYYTKIYLSGTQKYFAEYSNRSDESTLANLPLNPVLAYVSACKATITWMLPSGGADGYRTEASSTNFVDGDIESAQVSSGLQATMTLGGLSPDSTYYFRLASRNWQGDKNFTAVMSAVTLAGACGSPVTNLAAAPNHMGRTVTLTWANQDDPMVQGVLVVLSTNPVAATLPDGSVFNAGQAIGDGLVRGTASTNTYTDGGLALDVPYYYHLYAQDVDLTYSVSVSTSIFLDLPPLAPAGLTADLNPGGTQVNLAWSGVSSNRDGSPFHAPAAPMAVELAEYHIERATSVVNPNWVSVATVPVAAQTYAENIPTPGQIYYYRVSAVDSLGTKDTAMVVDTAKNVFVTAPDQVTRLRLPPSLSDSLLASRTPQGKDILIRAVEEAESVENKVFTSVRFEAYTAPDNQVLEKFRLPGPETDVVLAYKVEGGKVVPSGLVTSPASISVGDAPQNLGMYWNNGQKYVKLYGDVDPVNQTVSVKTAMTGSYQIRSLFRESGVTFDISGLSNKMITPNGDHLNDAAIFTFDNPKDSGFTGKIFDAEGAFVADMTPGPVVGNSLKWDAKANGRVVPGGVYAYQIRAEGKIFTGTLVVVR